MALYAFDGTWNADKPGADRDTNVRWFVDAYERNCIYKEGVGTRFGLVGEAVGGITGAGGHTRVNEMYHELVMNLNAGDEEIDVVGFSRGAALALHFANRIADIKPAPPPIRFLGLWDCVPSFGIASIDIDFTWDLDLPDNVAKCYHALALDERRQTFHLHRLSAKVERADQEGRLFELWFRGIHSDVGGGNLNHGLSSIALNWILKKAAKHGLPISTSAIDANVPRMKPDSPMSPGAKYDIIKNRRRTVRWNDQVHNSVSPAQGGNNPPQGLAVVNDDGVAVGKFPKSS
jgi:uncharacterized protein (DUF2235 family)